jgi:hypothetical protein
MRKRDGWGGVGWGGVGVGGWWGGPFSRACFIILEAASYSRLTAAHVLSDIRPQVRASIRSDGTCAQVSEMIESIHATPVLASMGNGCELIASKH